ncbi:protein CURVATURE THYLAKOID 1D, chloroplastic isoform X2 [Abrus precatorius]|uniref:Protein CURVATURE THYLAKOID 1D, chloroplastic isoform X2 n=1 Tax=Abrus precatorius TaxID=3816 RepID=A0A8B8M2D1_ABRPR|nr:protein CURVATURE THYLAKOID 1D, chloroplastic isoform X2 [Abrus precatorius]
MGLCTVQPLTLSKLPKPSLPHRQTPLSPIAIFFSRSICFRNRLPKATTSEDRSGGASQAFDEKREGVITLEDDKAVDKNEFNENEDTKGELPDDGQGLSLDLLDKLNFDTVDTGSIVLYGGGVLVALWLTSAVIGAIDSIPLFPKLLEVVGLAYTLWFSSRYLLFKKNREELAIKVEELKQQVFGSEDN